MRFSGDRIYTGKINLDETEKDQANLFENLVKYNNKSKPNSNQGTDKKRNTFDSVSALYEGQELALNAFRSRMFPIKVTQGKGRPFMLALHPSELTKRLKMLTPKQMLQRLPITLAQIKAGNTSKNFLNEIRQIRYSPY